MLDWQLGSRELPTEAEPQALRDAPEFDTLEAEINKLVDIHAASPTDWHLVADLASKILANQGKDLSVAAWLVAAWVQTDNAVGLAAGFHVLRDLHTLHWDTMLPPVKRIRGRRNQIDWLLNMLEKSFLDHDAENWPALTDEQYQGLQDDWDFVDNFWQEKDDQAPSFFKLRKYIDALPVESAAGAEPAIEELAAVESQPAVADQPELAKPSQSAGTATQATAESKPEIDNSPVKAEPEKQIAASQAGTGTADIDLPELSVNDLEDQTAIENYIERGLEAIQKPLPAISDELLYTPLMYRFNRQCAWLTIDQLPNANESITALPAPVPTDQDSLQNLIDANDANAILRFCESRLPVYRFWLDLNHAAYTAASQHSQAVADAILQETAYFIGRLPGILDLCFNNEQAFASEATKNWLLNSKIPNIQSNSSTKPAEIPKPQKQSGIAATPHTEDTIAYATTLAVASAETKAALNLLEVVANRLQSAADNLNSSK